MKKIIYLLLGVLGVVTSVAALPYRYSLCDQPGVTCLQTQGESWSDIWPDEQQRDVVMRFNRMNSWLRPGTVLAVPDDLENLDRMDISPFSFQISPPGRRTIIIDPNRLAWGAYDASGRLLNWGPASCGDYCPDVKRKCKTPAGVFTIYNKRGADCVSTKFPVGKGGAPMPYCMYFKGGYGMHGSPYVPGCNASHGCVRLFPQDARWLNKTFSNAGTKVVVYGY